VSRFRGHSAPRATAIRRVLIALGLCGAALLALPPALASPARGGAAASASPIKHVVVIYQENHSFNDLLGYLCVTEGGRCAGTTTGEISNGTKIPLKAEKDVPPGVGHEPADQLAAINGGMMNGWDHVQYCDASHSYQCLIQAHAGRVPTLWTLADTYAMSDMTFETSGSASWGSHLELVAATMDGFIGDEPQTAITPGKGSGCDSKKDTTWQGPGYPNPILVPSCVPDAQGQGPYRSSPVQYVPTIMDTLDAAGRSWHIYAPPRKGDFGYGWAICPTFYECLGSHQHDQVRLPTDFSKAAQKGNLPSLSIVIPYPPDSQHNSRSLMQGDNWIAKNVNAVMQGPDWNSTAIFITYDDCGCFYDPVPPPDGDGVRVPMVIVSPYAKPHFVDHKPATLASILAFAEHQFGLAPLPGGADGMAYDYAKAFNFSQRPLPAVALPLHTVPRSSLAYIAAHPPDADDPT
jgi:phospholipase C